MRLSQPCTGRRALIFGVTGQDGSYLAAFLLERGYLVFGTSRFSGTSRSSNLKSLNISSLVQVIKTDVCDFNSVRLAVRESDPDEIYFLAGQTSVGLSFLQPSETFNSNVIGLLNVLEVVRNEKRGIRVYNAGSSESFGDTLGRKANEKTVFNACSPYGVSKVSSQTLAAHYREVYDLFACSGILFNHESPLRAEHFVTQKIVKTLFRISNGSKEFLQIGRTDIVRDWGWAPEYVVAMWRMLQLETASDFVIATGESHSLHSFMSHALTVLGLDWDSHIREDSSLYRAKDLAVSLADTSKARSILDWEPQIKMHKVVELMIQAQYLDQGPSSERSKSRGKV